MIRWVSVKYCWTISWKRRISQSFVNLKNEFSTNAAVSLHCNSTVTFDMACCKLQQRTKMFLTTSCLFAAYFISSNFLFAESYRYIYSITSSAVTDRQLMEIKIIHELFTVWQTPFLTILQSNILITSQRISVVLFCDV